MLPGEAGQATGLPSGGGNGGSVAALSPFQARALLPASSASTTTTDSSGAASLQQSLQLSAVQEQRPGSGSRPSPPPPRLPSAALLSGASSISIARWVGQGLLVGGWPPEGMRRRRPHGCG